MLRERFNKVLHIAIAEPSEMLREGLAILLDRTYLRYEKAMVDDLDELAQFCSRKSRTLVIVDPILVVNQTRKFMNLKATYPNTAWIGLQYIYFERQIMEIFNEVITLYDTPETIASKLKRMDAYLDDKQMKEQPNTLSERETEVLLHLASGKTNKEIADILNISINTVITHRKNISQKTGIKTVSGLTIYAIAQGLIKA
ncbi:MAG TPA: response regulator transcription factor [Bacteroidales bacterium]|nr:response regulator transcription factor [Bacteroidales bacterium]HPO65148.1 response regulator transcription factor [Bacteroidales bacterium]